MPPLRLGSSGPQVTSLQVRLKELNFDPSPMDGDFRPSKEAEESISTFNTKSRDQRLDLYDTREDLGNQGANDGADFKGRGFVQLTGRADRIHA